MSSTTSEVDLTSVTDPLLFGALLDWAFLGVLCVQVYLYRRWDLMTDSTSLVALVYFVFIIEIAETGLVTYTVRQCLSVEWGNLATLAIPPSGFKARAIPVSLVTTIVELYFARRIHTLGRRQIFTFLAILVAVMSVIQCGMGITFLFVLESESINAPIPEKIWSGIALFCDIIIAGVFSYLFWTLKGNMLNSSVLIPVVKRTMQSSGLAALASLCHVAFFVKNPTGFTNITVVYLLGKLFANILLVDINRRQRSHNLRNSYMDLDPVSTRAPSPMSQREAGTLRIVAAPVNERDMIDPFAGGMPADPEVTSITSTSFGPPPTYRSL